MSKHRDTPLPRPTVMSLADAEDYALGLCAITFDLEEENLLVIPDPGPDGWRVKDKSTGEHYEVPAGVQRDLGFPRGEYELPSEDSAKENSGLGG